MLPILSVEVEYAEPVELAPGVDGYAVAKLETHEDGSTRRILHVMPAFAIACRMAEYGVEQDEAVDILTAEPYLPAETSAAIHTDPLWRRGAAQYRERIGRARDELGFAPLDDRVPGPSADPLEPLRAHPVDPDEVEFRRWRTAEVRDELRRTTPVRHRLEDVAPPMRPARAAAPASEAMTAGRARPAAG